MVRRLRPDSDGSISSLLSEASLGSSLGLVCKWAVALSGATAAALMTEEGGGRRAVAAAGDAPSLAYVTEVMGTVEDLAKSAAIDLGNGLVTAIYPISFPKCDGAKTGALVIVGAEPVLEPAPGPGADEVMASLASQAVLAFELADVRSERDRLLISADREASPATFTTSLSNGCSEPACACRARWL